MEREQLLSIYCLPRNIIIWMLFSVETLVNKLFHNYDANYETIVKLCSAASEWFCAFRDMIVHVYFWILILW